MNTNEIKTGGLLPSVYDERDFSAEKTFGSLSLAEIPDFDFIIADPLEIKNQKYSQMCTAGATAAIREDQEGVPLSMEFFFAMENLISGQTGDKPQTLRTACKTAVDKGFLEKKDAPFIFVPKNAKALVMPVRLFPSTNG